jgi:hypothetical protein
MFSCEKLKTYTKVEQKVRKLHVPVTSYNNYSFMTNFVSSSSPPIPPPAIYLKEMKSGAPQRLAREYLQQLYLFHTNFFGGTGV